MKSSRFSPLFVIIVFFFLHHCTKTAAQRPVVGRANITAILEKGGQFSFFIRLLGITQLGNQINRQINNLNQGITVFAPTDNAFSNLKTGTLNSLSDEQKIKLVQFHVLPNLITATQFATVSNPIRTEAGNSAAGQFPLNVVTSGNQVNLTTGVNVATVSNNTLFTGRNLAVYQVDSVLLPAEYFGTPAPAPAPSKPVKDVPVSTPKAATSDNSTINTSSAVKVAPFGVAVFAAFVAFWL